MTERVEKTKTNLFCIIISFGLGFIASTIYDIITETR